MESSDNDSPRRSWAREKDRGNKMPIKEKVTIYSNRELLMDPKLLIQELGFDVSLSAEEMGRLVKQQYRIAVAQNDYQWVYQLQRECTLFFSEEWIVENIPHRDPSKNIRRRRPNTRSASVQDPAECRDIREHMPVYRFDEGAAATSSTLQKTDAELEEVVPSSYSNTQHGPGCHPECHSTFVRPEPQARTSSFHTRDRSPEPQPRTSSTHTRDRRTTRSTRRKEERTYSSKVFYRSDFDQSSFASRDEIYQVRGRPKYDDNDDHLGRVSTTSSSSQLRVTVRPEERTVHYDAGSRKRRSEFLTATTEAPTTKRLRQSCPIRGCTTTSPRMKWHVYSHLPVEFSIYSTEDEPEEEFYDICRLAGLKFLARTILGKNSTLRDLMNFTNKNWNAPGSINVTPEIEDAIRRVHELIGSSRQRSFSLSPVNSPACLIHWRVLVFLFNHLTEEQQVEFAEATKKNNPQKSTTARKPSKPTDSKVETATTMISTPPLVQSVEVSSETTATGFTSQPKPLTPGFPSLIESTKRQSRVPLPEMSITNRFLPLEPVFEEEEEEVMDVSSPLISPVLESSEVSPVESSLPTAPAEGEVLNPADWKILDEVEEEESWTVVAKKKPPKSYAEVAATTAPVQTKSPTPKVQLDVDKSLPSAFDSHFHINRMSRMLGDSLESPVEALNVPAGRTPDHRVGVSRGVAVYCDPDEFKDVKFPEDPNWRVAVGVHPKKAKSFEDSHWRLLQQHLSDPRVAALGEVGLDHTVPERDHAVQEQVLEKVLTVCGLGHVLVLHVRGSKKTDPLGDKVYAKCLEIVQKKCSMFQRIHLHCFNGSSTTAKSWSKAFPNCHFGFTGLVKKFNTTQRNALAWVPLNKLLVETDAPYLPVHDDQTLNTPAFIGDVASEVARVRMMPIEHVLQATEQNGRSLYGYRASY